MKLSARDSVQFFAKSDLESSGLLIYGADNMRVALHRQDIIKSLIGPDGDDEMRLTRIAGSDLRKEPALLLDAVKAQGFFPGTRVAFVEEATDTLALTITNAFAEWEIGDAVVVVTARQLNARSALRKLFENHQTAFAVGIYDDPPSRDEILASLTKSGFEDVGQDALGALEALARSVDPGDFRQIVEKLSLYKRGDTVPVQVEDIVAVSPASTEADIDDVLNVVADAKSPEVGPLVSKLASQGGTAVGLCIGATRHFRLLHGIAANPQAAASFFQRQRIFGPRRDKMQRQARNWGVQRLELALSLLIETDLQLRSTSRAPTMAVMERTLIRLSMMAGSR